MEQLFYYTGLIVWIVFGFGLFLTGIAYFGSVLYDWYRSYDNFIGGNNIKSGVKNIFVPFTVGFYYLWAMMCSKEKAKKISDVFKDVDIDTELPIIKRTMVLIFRKRATK